MPGRGGIFRSRFMAVSWPFHVLWLAPRITAILKFRIDSFGLSIPRKSDRRANDNTIVRTG